MKLKKTMCNLIKNNSNVPDGKYNVKMKSINLFRSINTKKLVMKWELEIINSCYDGNILYRENIIKNKDNMKWIKRDLNICGINYKKIYDYLKNIQSIVGVELEISKRTFGVIENIFLIKRVV